MTSKVSHFLFWAQGPCDGPGRLSSMGRLQGLRFVLGSVMLLGLLGLESAAGGFGRRRREARKEVLRDGLRASRPEDPRSGV